MNAEPSFKDHEIYGFTITQPEPNRRVYRCPLPLTLDGPITITPTTTNLNGLALFGQLMVLGDWNTPTTTINAVFHFHELHVTKRSTTRWARPDNLDGTVIESILDVLGYLNARDAENMAKITGETPPASVSVPVRITGDVASDAALLPLRPIQFRRELSVRFDLVDLNDADEIDENSPPPPT